MKKVSSGSREFLDFLVSQAPVYDKLILADIRCTDSWLFEPRASETRPYGILQFWAPALDIPFWIRGYHWPKRSRRMRKYLSRFKLK